MLTFELFCLELNEHFGILIQKIFLVLHNQGEGKGEEIKVIYNRQRMRALSWLFSLASFAFPEVET